MNKEDSEEADERRLLWLSDIYAEKLREELLEDRRDLITRILGLARSSDDKQMANLGHRLDALNMMLEKLTPSKRKKNDDDDT